MIGLFEPGDAVDVLYNGHWIPAYFCRYEGADEALVKYAGAHATAKACWPGSYYQGDLRQMRHTVTVEVFQNHQPACDCGGERARTTHSHWCSTYS